MLPIVFIHTGTASYVPYSLWQARRAGGPDTEVVLLGDESNRHLNGLVRHVPLKNYWKGAAELDKIFVNYSSNGRDFELICLQRWLALAEWMKAEGHAQCLYLDTDVLLFSEAKPLMQKWQHFGMTTSGISGHTNLVGKREVLEDFGGYVMDMYSSTDGKEKLKKIYLEEFKDKQLPGGISDMTFLTQYRNQNPNLVANLSEPDADDTVFDITMDYTEYFEAQNGFKKIVLKNGVPYGIFRPNSSEIRFHTLHFQGKGKPLLPDYVPKEMGLNYWVFINRFYTLITKIKARFNNKRAK